MTSDCWEEINRFYDAAVEVEETERISFLEKACGGDVGTCVAKWSRCWPTTSRPSRFWIGRHCR